MSITLVQGLGLTIMAMIVGIDFWLEALFIFRPIIVGTLAGMILGNVTLGMLCGGITELAFAGLTPAGGTQPPNPVLAAIMAVVIAYTTGAEASSAMAMALPFSFLMQYIILFTYSLSRCSCPVPKKRPKQRNRAPLERSAHCAQASLPCCMESLSSCVPTLRRNP